MTRPSFLSCSTASATEGVPGTRSRSLARSSSSPPREAPKGEGNSGEEDSPISGEGGGRECDAARTSGARCQQSVRRVPSFSSSMQTERSGWPAGRRGLAAGRWTVSALLFVGFGLFLLLGSCTVTTTSALETAEFTHGIQHVDGPGERQQLNMFRDTHSKRRTRVKRQLLYFVLNFLGEEGIRSYVKNTKTENIPSLMGSVGADEILYIVSSLPPDEIMRVLTSLPPKDVLTLAVRMTPPQLMQLLSYVPAEGLTNLTNAFNSEQLQKLVTLLPPAGIVNLTKAVPPQQARKLLKSLSPGAIFNMTQSMTPATLVELMTVLPPDIVLDLTQTLSPGNLDKLLKSLPPEVLVTLITSLPRGVIRQLISSLPPGFIESFVRGITPTQLGKMVASINAEQVAKLMTSFPAEHAPDVSSLMRPELVAAALESLPEDLIANLTRIVPPRKLSKLISALPLDKVLMVTTSISTEQIMGIVGSIPPEAFSTLIPAIPADTLVALSKALPVQTLVNLTVALAQDPEVMSSILDAVLSPNLVTTFSASFPQETVVEILRQLPEETIAKLAAALPVKKVLALVTSVSSALPGNNVAELMKAVPKSVLVKVVNAVPTELIADVSQKLTRKQLRKMVRHVTPEMVQLMMTSIRPETVVKVMTALPKAVTATVFEVISPQKLSEIISAVPVESILTLTSSISTDQMVEIMGCIPPAAFSRLVAAMPPDTLVALSTSLPVDAVVNLTVAMADDPELIASVLNAVMSPDLITKLSASFPEGALLGILRKLPDETIGKLAAALPVKKAFDVANSLSFDRLAANLTKLMEDVPTSLIVKVAQAVPPEVIANMSEKLSRNQLKKLVRFVTPQMVRLLMTSVPPEILVSVAKALPESVVSTVLNVISPKHFRSLVRAVPIDTIKVLTDLALLEDPARHSFDLIVATTQKVANILLSIPPDVLTRLIKAIPRDFLVEVIDSLPAQAIAEGAAILSGEEGVPLATALPIEATAYAVSIIPPESIVRMVDAIPQRTIGAIANMAIKIPADRIQAFFRLVHVGALKHVITKLPPRTVEKLASSVPLEIVGKMAQSFSPVTVAPIMESLRPRELRRLIRSVNTTTLSNLLNSIPQDVIVNLTQALPAEQIAKLAAAFPPELISQVVTHMDPTGMVALMKAMPPNVLENILTTLPTDLIVNMTKILPPEQMQDLLDLLPESMIGKMVSILPKDVLVDLVKAFDADAMLDMMQKLSPEQLMDILSTLPHQVILNITKSQTPEQTMKLLASLPPDGIVNLTQVMPIDVMLEMMQSVPPEGLLGLIASMPLKDLFTLANQLTPEQMRQVMEQFAADKDLIPNLLASLDMDRILSMVEAVPPQLLLQVVNSVDMGMVMGLVQQFMPMAKAMLLQKMDEVLRKAGSNSTATFQHCLSDLGIVGRGLFNFSEWAFHFVDASGKPGRGMLEGNIHMIGNFDQCKKIQHVITGGSRAGDVIAGSYCHVQFEIPLEHLPPIPGDGILPMPEIAMDVCLPASCRDFDLHGFLKTIHLPLNVSIPRVACQRELHISQDPAALIVCVFIVIIILFVVVGTVVDCIFLRRSHSFTVDNNDNSKYSVVNGHTPTIGRVGGGKTAAGTGKTEEDIKTKEKLLKRGDAELAAPDMTEMQLMPKRVGAGEAVNGDSVSLHSHGADHVIVRAVLPDDPLWLRAVTAFSLPASVRRLLATRDGPDSVHCLHGMRVLSMLWVIFANSMVFGALYFENLLHAANDLISMPAQVILNSSLSQDTFFTISGVVTAVTFFRAVSGSDRLRPGHMIYYYLHRFVRVSPAYVFMLAVCACLIGYVADGPHWPPPLQEQCAQQWWTNLLFINNYFVSIEHMCMSWTWFLADLMQFYWIAPLVLIPFAFGLKIVGFLAVGGLVVVHLASTIALEIGVNGDVLRRQSEYFWSIYQQPWCRVAPFALGLGLGFILTRIRFRQTMGKVVMGVGWLLAFLVSTILTLITYEENRYLLEDAGGWSVATRTVHETLQRPLWALVVCWVIFACSTGNGGPVDTVLSWRGFLPLSRLTYCVYLVHPVVIICDLLAYRVFAYFTIGYVLFRYLGYVVVSYFLALLLSVLTESPILALERAVLSSFKRS